MELLRETRVEIGWVTWQARPPRASLTILAKATFAIDPDARTCALANEQAPLTGDVHQRDDPDASLRFESDLAVLKPRGEWVLAGTCHPQGGPRAVSAVSAAVGASRKEIAVFGDREVGMLGSVRDAKSFASMALTWERAYGGPGFAENPFGRGIAATETPEGKKTLWPNLQSAMSAKAGEKPPKEAIGFGPLPRGSAIRTRRLGTYDRAWREKRWPFFPEDFDFEHFLAAPEDQRIEGYFRGDEDVELVNMHPRHGVIRERLPGIRPRVLLRRKLIGPDGKPAGTAMEEVQLRLDTIAIDADALRIYATWRGLTEVADDDASDVASVHAIDEPITASTASDDIARGIAERETAAQAARERLRRGEDAPAPSARARAAQREVTKIQRDSLTPDAAVSPEPAAAARAAVLERLAPALARPSRPFPGADSPPVLKGQDFTGADLSGMDLRNADLRGAILQDARITDAMLDGARLDEAVLAGAYLSRSSLRGASLVGADLTNTRARKTSFQNATLSRATLHDADLASAVLDGAQLDRAELVGARAADATFFDANLDRADLRRAFLGRAKLDGASLVRANLEGAGAPDASFARAKLERVKAKDAVFTGASFVRAEGPNAIFIGATLERCDLSYATLDRANLSGANLVSAVLHGTKLKSARLAGARLVSAAILKANLMEAIFEDADLRGADLRGSNLHGAQLWRARTDGALLDLAIVTRTHLA